MPRSVLRRSRLRSTWAAAGAALLALVTAVVVLTSATALPADAGPSGWLHTSGSRILDDHDQPYVVRAVSWFGMETETCAPHGLWRIGLDQGLAQIASFGFNTIRLPFSNECLAAHGVTGVDPTLNPDLVGRTPLEVMDAVVAGAKAHGLRVVLDRHRPDSTAQSPLWSTDRWSTDRWIADWVALAQRYRDEPTVVGVDLHNEPHGDACWGCDDPARDWVGAAERAGNAVLAANPRLLVLVEGVDQTSAGPTWWGGGLADARTHPVRLDVPGRLVYSPHEYPASISPQPWFDAPDYPRNLPARWDAQWGYLEREGIAPVVLGEFGTRLETASDRAWLTTLVGYLDDHQTGFAYWSYNPDSGDTGGLVGDDWTTPQRAKLQALAPILRAPAGPVSSPAPTPTNASAGASGVRAEWSVQDAWPGGYVAQLTLTAEQARDGWTLAWPDPDATSVVSAWGMRCTTGGGTVTCTGTDWGAQLRPGQPVRVGLQVASRGAAPTAPTLAVG